MRVPSPDQAATSVSPETIVLAPLPSAFMTVSAKPPTASRFPFGAHAADPPAATRWASLPSAATIQIDGAELSSLTRTKETSRPSGDHDACVSRSGPLVSRLKPVPSAFMTKTSKSCRVSRPRPSRTSWCPSEEKSARLAEKSFVNRRWCVPFGFMTKTCARPPKARSLQNEILPFRTLPGAVRSERPTAAANVGSGSGPPTSIGTGGAAASVEKIATQAAIGILRDGGNAVDAAVAAAAVLGVTEPFSCGIGGGGFLVVRTANGAVTTIDGRETAPAAMHPTSFWVNGAPLPFNDARYSGLSVGVPGTVETWVDALQKFGTMSLTEVFAPAIQ